MNSCILMVEISSAPQLRHTPDNMEVAEMMVMFPGLRADDPPATLRVVGWGKTASELHANYQAGDRVIIEGRLGMRSFDRPEGFKEKRADFTVQRIYRVGGEFNLGNMATPAPAIPSYEPSIPTPAPTYQPTYQQPDPTLAPTYQPPAAPTYSQDYDSDDIPF